MGWAKINHNGVLKMIETVDDFNEVVDSILEASEDCSIEELNYHCVLLSCHFQKPMQLFKKNVVPVEYDESKFKN